MALSLRLVVLVLIVASLFAAEGAAARTSASESTAAELRRVLRPAGGGASAVVEDAGGRRILDLRATKLRPLGSTTKLFTAAAVLERFVPALTTSVLASAPIGPDGVLAGDLFLFGGGDPSLGSTGFSRERTGAAGTDGAALAQRLTDLGLREIRGAVVGDERLFDARRAGRAGVAFDAELDGVLGGLTWNRGRAGADGAPLSDPARGAAAAFDDALEARGVVIRDVARAGVTPDGARELARIERRAATLVGPMLKLSDDFYAETLAKGLAARLTGAAGTTAAGARAVQSAVRRLGARPRLADGSGLSARSRGTARDLVRLLRVGARRSWGPTFTRALPVAGRDGTLRRRLRSVQGRCRAKTGSLGTRLSALAGTCRTQRGRTVRFAVLVERISPARGRALVDRVATTLARSRI